eukprot:9145739-Ditylum_brightwellii.AAC.1
MLKRIRSGRSVDGFGFLLLKTKCIAVVFFADHGNKAFQVALGVNASEEGQSSPRKIAHLMAKDSQDILVKIIQPNIHKGTTDLHSAAVVVIQNKHNVRLTLVHHKSIIGAFTDIFQRFIMCEPHDSGNGHQQILSSVAEDDIVTRRADFTMYQTDNGICGISGIRWKRKNSNEYENKLFCDRVIEINKETTLNAYPLAVFGVSDMEYQALALDKENFSSCYFNHCQQKQ